MTQSVLGGISLGYQLEWNQLRQICGVELFIESDPAHAPDAAHLLRALGELWSEQAPILTLSIKSPKLLADMLQHGAAAGPWIEVHDRLLADRSVDQLLHQAHARGLKLIWRGEPGTRVSAALAASFHKQMIGLTADEALVGVRASLQKHNGSPRAEAARAGSPVLAEQIYEGVASRVLTEHCLDEQGAWAVLGWPMEDVLHGYRHQLIQPSHRAIVRLVEAADADESTETIEHFLSEEPILAYRFLRYANAEAVGLRSEIDSLRHGLMVLGYSRLKNWLLEQLPHATSDLNLQPIRSAMVIRARLMEHLLDAGDEDKLRREVYLCGLLSQIDLLLGEPLAASLQRLPLPERVTAAILQNAGAYAPYLELAAALETADTRASAALCALHKLSLEQVNRALLRTLCMAQPHPARGLLLV